MMNNKRKELNEQNVPIAQAGNYVLLRNRYPTGYYEGTLVLLLDDLLPDGKARCELPNGFEELTAAELYVPRGFAINPDAFTAPAQMRLPYGLWECEDGTQYLYNRSYVPIWKRANKDAPAEQSARLWVHYNKQRWLFDDSSSPQRNKATVAKCERVLARWGITEDMRFHVPEHMRVGFRHPAEYDERNPLRRRVANGGGTESRWYDSPAYTLVGKVN